MNCKKCESLCASRTQIVEPDLPEFGRPCRVLVIGEAPGADEDAQGKGFVGRSGRTLHALLEEHWLRRAFDYGCVNIVRCRPPENRRPSRDEIGNCLPFLAETLERVNPECLLLVGGTATALFYGAGSLAASIRELRRNNGRPRTGLAHPALQGYLRGHAVRLIPMPHTSPLAWNRNAPDGRKWGEVGREQVQIMARMLKTGTDDDR